MPNSLARHSQFNLSFYHPSMDSEYESCQTMNFPPPGLCFSDILCEDFLLWSPCLCPGTLPIFYSLFKVWASSRQNQSPLCRLHSTLFMFVEHLAWWCLMSCVCLCWSLPLSRAPYEKEPYLRCLLVSSTVHRVGHTVGGLMHVQSKFFSKIACFVARPLHIDMLADTHALFLHISCLKKKKKDSHSS